MVGPKRRRWRRGWHPTQATSNDRWQSARRTQRYGWRAVSCRGGGGQLRRRPWGNLVKFSGESSSSMTNCREILDNRPPAEDTSLDARWMHWGSTAERTVKKNELPQNFLTFAIVFTWILYTPTRYLDLSTPNRYVISATFYCKALSYLRRWPSEKKERVWNALDWTMTHHKGFEWRWMSLVLFRIWWLICVGVCLG